VESKVNYSLVGGFVLVLGTALIAGVLWLASGGGFQKKTDLYMALVNESVAGLNLNALVKYRGVDVGKVREIGLNPENPEQVRLIFAIDRGTPVKEDSAAVLKTQGLTGIAYVELEGGTQAAAPLRVIPPAKYPVINTKPSLSARLENILTSVLAKLDTTSDNVNKLLSDDNVAALKSTLADLATVAHTLAARKDAIDAGVVNAARTFDNSARLSAQLGPLAERIGRSADALRKMGEATERASVATGKTVEQVGADIKLLTIDTLPEFQNLLGEMNVLAGSLQHLIKETDRNPRRFLFGHTPLPEGPGEGADSGKGSGSPKGANQ